MKKAELEAKLVDREEYIKDLQKRLRMEIARANQEAARYSQLVTEHNALLEMLHSFFQFHVYAKDYDGDEPLWIVEDKDTGVVLGQPAKGWEAYKEAMRMRIAGI